MGFEPTISAGEQPQTYALDCAATGTGPHTVIVFSNNKRELLELSWVQESGIHVENFFFILNILPLMAQYIFSLLLFVVNKYQIQMNSEMHNVNNRNNFDFYQPSSHLTIYKKKPLLHGN